MCKVYVRADNAGCYHCSQTIAAPKISAEIMLTLSAGTFLNHRRAAAMIKRQIRM